MKTKLTSRLLAAFLAIMMVVGLLPMSALAAHVEDDAIQIAAPDTTVSSRPAQALDAKASLLEGEDEPVNLVRDRAPDVTTPTYVSGVGGSASEYDTHNGDMTVDGEIVAESRWRGNHIKGLANAANNHSWIVVDLGEDVASVSEIKIHFHFKTRATDYVVQVATDQYTPTTYFSVNQGEADVTGEAFTGKNAKDDAAYWTTIATVEGRAYNNENIPCDTFTSDDWGSNMPSKVRYLRFYFTAMNSSAGENGVSVDEIQVFGTRGEIEEPVSREPAFATPAEAEAANQTVHYFVRSDTKGWVVSTTAKPIQFKNTSNAVVAEPVVDTEYRIYDPGTDAANSDTFMSPFTLDGSLVTGDTRTENNAGKITLAEGTKDGRYFIQNSGKKLSAEAKVRASDSYNTIIFNEVGQEYHITSTGADNKFYIWYVEGEDEYVPPETPVEPDPVRTPTDEIAQTKDVHYFVKNDTTGWTIQDAQESVDVKDTSENLMTGQLTDGGQYRIYGRSSNSNGFYAPFTNAAAGVTNVTAQGSTSANVTFTAVEGTNGGYHIHVGDSYMTTEVVSFTFQNNPWKGIQMGTEADAATFYVTPVSEENNGAYWIWYETERAEQPPVEEPEDKPAYTQENIEAGLFDVGVTVTKDGDNWVGTYENTLSGTSADNERTGSVITASAISYVRVPSWNDGPAWVAVDGNTGATAGEGSFKQFHTAYDNASTGNGTYVGSPASVAAGNRYIDLKIETGAKALNGLRYYAGKNNNQAVTGYKIDVKASEYGTWRTVAEGTWTNTLEWKYAAFDEVATALYVRLWGVSTVSGTHMSAGEVRLVLAEEQPEAVAADKTGLAAKIAETADLTQSLYTEESWNALQTAVTAANALIDDADATQDAVDEAIEALTAAIEGLETAGPEVIELPEKTVGMSQHYLHNTGSGWAGVSTLAELELHNVTDHNYVKDTDGTINSGVYGIYDIHPGDGGSSRWMHAGSGVTNQCGGQHSGNDTTHEFTLTYNPEKKAYTIQSVSTGKYVTQTASGSQLAMNDTPTWFYITPASEENHTYYIWWETEVTFADMFDLSPDNTWVFTGGADVEGGWAQTRGNRNFMGHFEEFVRWTLANSRGTNENGGATSFNQPRQRYMVNTAKTGQSLKDVVDNWDSLVAKYNPRAVVYMVGTDDLANASTFETDLTSFLEKAAQLRDGKGMAVVIKSYNGALADLNAIVDTLTADKATVKAVTPTGITEMNAAAHYSLGQQLANATYGSSNNYPTNSTTSTANTYAEKAAPTTYNTAIEPTVTWADGNMTIAVAGAFTYEVRLASGVTVSGSGTDSATVTGLTGTENYTLVTRSADGATQYKTLTGAVGGGAANVTKNATETKIAELMQSTEPLTWLFMGDSITHGAAWTSGYDSVSQSFDKYLDMLGRDQDVVINTAVSSADTRSTLAAIDYRLNQYPAPDVVSIMLGTNDWNSLGHDENGVNTYKNNLKAIVDAIKAKNADAIIILRSPTSDFNNGQRATHRDAMKAVATELGLTFIDQEAEFAAFAGTYSAWAAPSGTQLYFGNSLHPGAQGHVVMTKMFIKALGLWNEDTPIANLDYVWPNMTTETSATVTSAAVRANRSVLTLDVSELGSNLGETTFTATNAAGQSWSVTAAAGEDAQLTLPDGAYTVTAVSVKTNEAKTVTFTAGSVTVSENAVHPKLDAPSEPTETKYILADGTLAEGIYVLTASTVEGTSVAAGARSMHYFTGNANVDQCGTNTNPNVEEISFSDVATNHLWNVTKTAGGKYIFEAATVQGTYLTGAAGTLSRTATATEFTVEPKNDGGYDISWENDGTTYYLSWDNSHSPKWYGNSTTQYRINLYRQTAVPVMGEMAQTVFKGTGATMPMDPALTGSTFRIPALITLKNGWIVAASDVRWPNTGDSPNNLDTIVSVSKDGGETWDWEMVNYFSDFAPLHDGSTRSNSASFIDPALAVSEDGTLWMAVDLQPTHVNLGQNAQKTGSGFDESGLLMVGPISEDEWESKVNSTTGRTEATRLEYQAQYEYRVDINGVLTGDAAHATATATKNGEEITVYPIFHATEGWETGYWVDSFFDLYYDYGEGTEHSFRIVQVQQKDSDKMTQANLFYIQSPWKAYSTTYLMIRKATVTDDGLVWGDPKLVSGVKNFDGETFLAFCPGRGTSVMVNGVERMIFPVYDNVNGEKCSVVYTEDGGVTWHRGARIQNNNSGKTSESQIVILPKSNNPADGVFLRIYSRNTSGKVSYADSEDFGETWTASTNDDALAYGGNVMVSFIDVKGYLVGPDNTVYENIVLGSYPWGSTPESSHNRSNGVIRIGTFDPTTKVVTWLNENSIRYPGRYNYSCLTQQLELDGEHKAMDAFSVLYERDNGNDMDMIFTTVTAADLLGAGWSLVQEKPTDEVLAALPVVKVEVPEENAFIAAAGVIDLNTTDVKEITAKVTVQGTEDDTAVVTWTTSDPTVATVSAKTNAARLMDDEVTTVGGQEAVITAVGVGKAIITAVTQKDGFSRIDTIEVSVSDEDNITVPTKYEAELPAADETGATYPLDTDGLETGVYGIVAAGNNRNVILHDGSTVTNQCGYPGISNNVLSIGENAHKWTVTKTGENTYTIQGIGGRYLPETPADGSQLTLSETPVELTVTHTSDGNYTVRTASGKYLTFVSDARWALQDAEATVRFFKQTNAVYSVDQTGLSAMLTDAGDAEIPEAVQTAVTEAAAAAAQTYDNPVEAAEAQEKVAEASKLLYAALTGKDYGTEPPAPAVTYTVTFDANGGEGTMEPQVVAAGTLPWPTLTPNAFTREGYAFIRWNTEPDGNGPEYAATAFVPQRDITLYAQWEADVVVTPGDDVYSFSPIADRVYTGEAIEPALVIYKNGVPMAEGEYTVSYEDNTAVGTAKVTITIPVEDGDDVVIETSFEIVPAPVAPSFGGGSYVPPAEEDLEDPDVPLTQLPMTFDDVKADDWFFEAAEYVFKNDLMQGVSETSFQPYMNTTRGMVVTILHRMENKPEAAAANFPDVAANAWYSAAVAWGVESDVVKGMSDGGFHPTDDVTREQLALFLYRFASYRGYDVTVQGDLTTFADGATVSDWAADAMSWAVGTGLIGGKGDNLLDPLSTATRAELATILTRFCESFAE